MTRSPATLLLTNDDGVDAPGLAALTLAAATLGRPSVVIAPASPQSGCAQQVTTHRNILIETREGGRTAVHGSPADCVRLGLHSLAAETTLILSGINAGGNLGTDIHYSGTVGAVREGVIRGVPGIAVSHYIARGRSIDWERAARWTAAVLRRLVEIPWIPGTFWNVNLPHPEPGAADPRVVFCPVDPSPLPLDFRHEEEGSVYSGDYQRRERIEGGDVAVCFGGNIAVSLVVATSSLEVAPELNFKVGSLAEGDGLST